MIKCKLRSRLPLLLMAALGAAAPALAQSRIEFGITSNTAISLPHFIAEQKKFYAAENLAVETIVAGSAVNVIQQLGGGSLGIGQAATDQTIRAILRGAPIRIIGGAASNAPFRLVAAKGVTAWSELKGKNISVGGPTDVTLYFLHVMARKNGLEDTDYDLLYAGGTPDRFAHLLSGAVAAAVLTNPLDFTALAQGFVDLGSVPHYLPNWAQNNLLVNTRWAQQNRAAVVAFLRAQIRASEYFYDARNRDEVIAILVKQTGSTPQTAAETYDFYVKERVVAAKAALFEAGIQANLDALVEMGELKSAPPPARFIDPSFLAEATP